MTLMIDVDTCINMRCYQGKNARLHVPCHIHEAFMPTTNQFHSHTNKSRMVFSCLNGTILLQLYPAERRTEGILTYFARPNWITKINLLPHITSRVPQGSILGPGLLFYYFNDLFSYTSNSKLMMLSSDDTECLMRLTSPQVSVLLQPDLD